MLEPTLAGCYIAVGRPFRHCNSFAARRGKEDQKGEVSRTEGHPLSSQKAGRDDRGIDLRDPAKPSLLCVKSPKRLLELNLYPITWYIRCSLNSISASATSVLQVISKSAL